MSEHVRVAVEDGVMRLTLARAEKKNALTNAMYDALADALQRADDDPAVRVVLFDAEGETFCAGNDLGDFTAVAAGSMPTEALRATAFLTALARARKPCVAAVQGAAVGIGTTLLLHCDLVFLAEDAVLSTPFVNLAVVPEAASSLLLPARIGHARAFAMFALGESLDGRMAVTMGLANAALPAAHLRDEALAAARALAAKPPGALLATKQLMRDSETLAAVMARENAAFVECLRSPETAAALRAFAQRRNPAHD